jgi:hypothetical protein
MGTDAEENANEERVIPEVENLEVIIRSQGSVSVPSV